MFKSQSLRPKPPRTWAATRSIAFSCWSEPRKPSSHRRHRRPQGRTVRSANSATARRSRTCRCGWRRPEASQGLRFDQTRALVQGTKQVSLLFVEGTRFSVALKGNQRKTHVFEGSPKKNDRPNDGAGIQWGFGPNLAQRTLPRERQRERERERERWQRDPWNVT